MATLLFNNFMLKPQPFSTLLNLIINHPLFQQKVIEFRQLFQQLELKSQHLVKLGTLYYTFILPEFPAVQHKKLAIQLYQSLQIDDSNQDVSINYKHLAEYLGKICQATLENLDLRNSVGFLCLLMDRITDTFIVNAQTNQRKKVPYHFKLQFFDCQTVINDSQMPEQFHRLMSKDVYFQEKVYYDEEALLINEQQVIVRELKRLGREVVPYGYVCQDFLGELINSDFQTKNSYRLKNNRKVSIQKIQYWISPNESVNNYVRDQIVNQQIFYATGILSQSYLPANPIQTSKATYSISRLNHAYSHMNYYQKLKDIKQDKIRYFNILSSFFERDEFNIDEITLTRERLIARRKQHLLGIQAKQNIKKDIEKDFDDEARMLPQRIEEQIKIYLDQKAKQLNIKQLSQALRHKLQEGKNIKAIIQNNLSQLTSLPKDSSDPFLQDVIQYASKQPIQLLVIGRPKSGKSSLARAVAKKYNLSYVSIESMVSAVYERLKFYQQNPPQTDEDGNVLGGLTHIEKCIIEDLNQGKEVCQEDLLDLINGQLQKDVTQSKGFIVDLPFDYHKYWVNCLVSNRITLPKINCRFFTHIIQIEQSDQQWKHFSEGIMQKPQDLTISSAFDRYLLSKPKPIPVQGQEQQQPNADQQQKPQPLKQDNLLNVKWKDGVFALIEHLTQHIHPRRFLKVQNAYQSVDECLNLLQDKLYVIPLAKRIEGTDKELLTVGHEETKLVRKWSPWGTVDPVELKNDKLINGKAEFAAEYAGRIFIFQNQNNLNTFINLPRRYLDKLPQLPRKTNICITGPRKSGKKTLAKRLSQIYKLQIIDIEQILQRVILKQKSLQSHVPSNPQKRSNTVHLSEGQFKQFSKGNLLNAKDVLPIVLYQLGLALQRKPAGWGVQKQQGGQNQQQEQKKAAPAKKKKKEKNQQEQRPRTAPVDDLPLKQIIPQINHLGKLSQIRGFIIINYPNNQQQLNSLRQFNIPIDKLIILNDNTEEAPNKVLASRLTDAELQQVALFFTSIQPVKEALGEDVFKEIPIDRTPEEVVNRVRQLIDPFYLKVDDDSINRVLADMAEDGDPVPLGFSGQYCPVAMSEKWLLKGKQDLQAGIQGRRFRFCGQKQLNQFKQNPKLYLNKQNTLIPPRSLFMGLRGVGLTTQLLKFNQRYKIPILNLKQTLTQQIQAQKNKRKTERYYRRGFKKPQFDEQGKTIDDQELNAEHPDFDKRANQIQITRKIFEGIDQIFIDGNFFDIDQQKVSTNIVELLTEARRLPEIVYVLKSEQDKWLQRNLNRSQIQRQLQQQIQGIKAQKRQKLQEARRAALQAGEEFNGSAEQEEEFPKLEDKIAAKQQALKAQREADMGALEGFVEAFRGLNIEVVQISCERQVKHVTDRINYSLKPYLEDRVNRWEKYNMLPIQRHRARDFLSSFTVKQSRFGTLNPLSLTVNTYSSPLIYNQRLYYLRDNEQRQAVLKDPSILDTNRPIPHDVNSVPGVFVIGKTKTGKTSLSQTLAQKLGLVYLSFTQIVQLFLHQHQDIEVINILTQLRNGKALSDDQIVTITLKRLSLFDCQRNGWVLDGLPQNKQQAELLNRKGVIPVAVFSLHLNDLQIKKRIIKAKSNLYEFDMQVAHQRLKKNRKNLAEVQLYYQNKYNNLKCLDGNLSKWGLFQKAKKIVQKKTKARRGFSRALSMFEAAQVSDVGLSFNCILNNMSQYQNYCPIAYKLRREYVRKCLKAHENLALYNKKLYIFNSSKQLNDFIQNPETFVTRGPSFQPPTQVQLEDFKGVNEKAENKGYCMVELLRKKLVLGNLAYGLIYKNKIYLTSTPKFMKLFIRNPTLYEMVKLPDKLPVSFQKKNQLKKIAKRNDCTAFLQHHLSNIMMRSLAQLGYRRPKYPTLSSKQSALKFLSLSLKSTNPNKDEEYRQKHRQQLQKFIKQSSLSEEIRSQSNRKNKAPQVWKQSDEENLIKLCEGYSQFMKQLQTQDKLKYFSEFIR